MYRILMKTTSWFWTLEMRSMCGLETSLHQKKGSWAWRWLRYESSSEVQVFWQWVIHYFESFRCLRVHVITGVAHPYTSRWLAALTLILSLFAFIKEKSQAAILTYCILPNNPFNAATLVSDFLPTVHQAVCLCSCTCMGDTPLNLWINSLVFT